MSFGRELATMLEFMGEHKYSLIRLIVDYVFPSLIELTILKDFTRSVYKYETEHIMDTE